MKIAVVGKGGSGKSSVSWLLSSYLSLRQNKKVLAIDADYNMDLLQAFSLQENIDLAYLNQCEPDFYEYLGLNEKDYYVDLPKKENLKHFSLEPKDSFTKKYATPLSTHPNLSLMATGPVNENHLYGHRCSHAYISALKFYIPLLDLPSESFMICDSVAGTDMVSYGLYLGIDMMIAVVELTRNSLGVYAQIRAIAQEFKIPLYIVINKVADDKDLPARIQDSLGEDSMQVLGHIPSDIAILNSHFGELERQTLENLDTIYRGICSLKTNPHEQWQRHVHWKERYDIEFEKSKQEKYTFIEGL